MFRFRIIYVVAIQVLIWDVEAQPNRHAVLGAAESRPDLVCYYLVTLFMYF